MSDEVEKLPFAKKSRVVLSKEKYAELQNECFTKDEWRCKVCCRFSPLQMHHMLARSHLRLDTLQNCISLCQGCHDLVTRHVIDIVWGDVELRTIKVTYRKRKS